MGRRGSMLYKDLCFRIEEAVKASASEVLVSLGVNSLAEGLRLFAAYVCRTGAVPFPVERDVIFDANLDGVVHFRIAPDVKAKTAEVFRGVGILSLSDGMRRFLHYVAQYRRIPFSLTLEEKWREK